MAAQKDNYYCPHCGYTTYIARGLLMEKPPECPRCNGILKEFEGKTPPTDGGI